MKVKIEKTSGLCGTIKSSPSKSYSHRAIFLAMLRGGKTLIENPLTQGDVAKTIMVCKQLGCNFVKIADDKYEIDSSKKLALENIAMDCGNSGTTIRILTALSLFLQEKIKITGTFFERNRPIGDLLDSLEHLGVRSKKLMNTDRNDKNPCGIELHSEKILLNRIQIRGDISSQFITGLIIAAFGLSNHPGVRERKKFTFDEFIIETTTPVKSYPYLLITKEICEDFGLKIEYETIHNGCLKITIPMLDIIKNTDNQKAILEENKQFSYSVPGDFSSAAFIIAAGALFGINDGIIIDNLNMKNFQGDKQIVHILGEMGASINYNQNQVIIQGRKSIFLDPLGNYKKYLSGVPIDCADIPDLLPILATISSLSKDTTELFNAEHVRLKETDRIAVMARELKKFSVVLEEFQDKLIIEGNKTSIKIPPKNLKIETEGDHRIIMALVILCLGLNLKNIHITIDGIENFTDSYPEFFKHLKDLGANLSLI